MYFALLHTHKDEYCSFCIVEIHMRRYCNVNPLPHLPALRTCHLRLVHVICIRIYANNLHITRT